MLLKKSSEEKRKVCICVVSLKYNFYRVPFVYSPGAVVFGEAIAAGLGTDGTNYWHTCWRHAAGEWAWRHSMNVSWMNTHMCRSCDVSTHST